MEKENFEKLRLEILTPTYIGGAENKNLSNKDYFLKDNAINIIDIAKLMKLLDENNVYEKFVCGVMSNKSITNILDNIGIKNYEDQIIGDRIQVETIGYDNGKNTLDDIKMFIKDNKGQPYIPASSLKGFITNAIAYNYILNNREKFKIIKDNIYDVRNLKGKWKEIQKIIFKEQRKNNDRKYEIDLRRYIKVSDATIVRNTGTFITEKEDFVVKSNNVKINTINIYREYVIPGAIFEFDIGINFNEMKNIGVFSMSDILNMIQIYTNRCIELDEVLEKVASENNKIFCRTVNEEMPNMILGGGSGYYSKSILSALFDDKKDLMQLVRKILKNHNHRILDKISSPRTLKIAKYNSKYYFVGMVRIGEI